LVGSGALVGSVPGRSRAAVEPGPQWQPGRPALVVQQAQARTPPGHARMYQSDQKTNRVRMVPRLLRWCGNLLR